MVAIPLNRWSWNRCLCCQLLTTRMLRSVSELGCIPLTGKAKGNAFRRQGKQAKRFSEMSEKEPLLKPVVRAIKDESVEWSSLRASGWDPMLGPVLSASHLLIWDTEVNNHDLLWVVENSVLWLKSLSNPRAVHYYPCAARTEATGEWQTLCDPPPPTPSIVTEVWRYFCHSLWWFSLSPWLALGSPRRHTRGCACDFASRGLLRKT